MKKLFKGLMIVGSILILGTAGASDVGTIEIAEITYRLLIGIGLFAVGFGGLRRVNNASRR